MWNIWSPHPDAITDSEYAVAELDNLMKEYNSNEKQKNQLFEKRKQQMIDDDKLNNSELLRKQMKESISEKKKTRIRQKKDISTL